MTSLRLSFRHPLSVTRRSRISLKDLLVPPHGGYGNDDLTWNGVGKSHPGYRADIIVVRHSPLEDIKHLKDIHTVVLQGEILDREALLQSKT